MVRYDWTSGQVFGRLTLTGKSYYDVIKKERKVEATCECGIIVWKAFEPVKKNRTRSCGCLSKEHVETKPAFKHGMIKHPLWKIYAGVKKRCYQTTCLKYPNYGGRGIEMYELWRKDFMLFYNWAMGNGWKLGLSLERNDVNGNYEPFNCRFISLKEQAYNKTTSQMLTIFGETKCLKLWIGDSRCVVKYGTALRRLYRGWDFEKVITTPARDNGFYKSTI